MQSIVGRAQRSLVPCYCSSRCRSRHVCEACICRLPISLPLSQQYPSSLVSSILSLTLRLHAFPHFVENGLAFFQFYTTMSMRSKYTHSAPPRIIRAVRRTSIIGASAGRTSNHSNFALAALCAQSHKAQSESIRRSARSRWRRSARSQIKSIRRSARSHTKHSSTKQDKCNRLRNEKIVYSVRESRRDLRRSRASETAEEREERLQTGPDMRPSYSNTVPGFAALAPQCSAFQ